MQQRLSISRRRHHGTGNETCSTSGSTHAVTDAECDVGNARELSRTDKVEVFRRLTKCRCQQRAAPTLLGYRTPHRRAAAGSSMGQVGGRAAGRGHSEGFPWNGRISPQNIWKMRGFFLAWTAEVRNLSRAVRESRRDKFLSQLAGEIDGEHPTWPHRALFADRAGELEKRVT